MQTYQGHHKGHASQKNARQILNIIHNHKTTTRSHKSRNRDKQVRTILQHLQPKNQKPSQIRQKGSNKPKNPNQIIKYIVRNVPG